MQYLMSTLTGFSETLFHTLAAHSALTVLTIAVAVAIWFLPDLLFRDAKTRSESDG